MQFNLSNSWANKQMNADKRIFSIFFSSIWKLNEEIIIVWNKEGKKTEMFVYVKHNFNMLWIKKIFYRDIWHWKNIFIFFSFSHHFLCCHNHHIFFFLLILVLNSSVQHIVKRMRLYDKCFVNKIFVDFIERLKCE